MSKSTEELLIENKLNEMAKEERRVSDSLYAIKQAQYAIFGLIGLLCTTVVIYLIKSVLK
jgi:hypothetical protein